MDAGGGTILVVEDEEDILDVIDYNLSREGFAVLRAFELRALRVLWDTNAYGSAQWLVVVSHGTLIAIELVEIAGMAAVFWFGTVERKHFSDVTDAAFYWVVLVLSWLPIYVLNYLGPRYFM